MALDPNQLDAAVAAADQAAGSAPLSDADLAAQLSTPIKTPRDARVPGLVVTYTSLASRWGAARAAQFAGAVLAGKANADPNFAGLCILADAVLSGPGLSPSDPQSQIAAAQFVAANLASQAEVDGAFYDVSYPAGDVVQAADVTASRARVAAANAAAAWSQQVTDATNAARDWFGTYANEYLPTVAQGGTITPFKDWLAQQPVKA